MDIQILKDNRNEIIRMIESKTNNDLKGMMIEVANIAQMGCYFDMDDMEDIINDAIQSFDNNIMSNGRNASKSLEAQRIESSRKLMQNI